MDIITLTKIVQEIYNATLQHEAKFKFLEKKNVIPSNFDEEFLKYINSKAIDIPSENPSNQENDKPSEEIKDNPSEKEEKKYPEDIYTNRFLTFKSEDESDFTILSERKDWDGKVYHSTNAKDWFEYDGNSVSSENGRLYFCGKNNTRFFNLDNYTKENENWNIIKMTSGKQIQCIGNIETMLDYEKVQNGEHPQMGEYCFIDFFKDCTSLVSAPELPALELSDWCYSNMFENCTSLREIPELPATKLTKGCYSNIFQDCTSITKAPNILPIMELTPSCYHSMFSGCTNLKNVPVLPAVSLPEEAYSCMFLNCTSLTNLPTNYQLPATILGKDCYVFMFGDCNNLNATIHLPASVKNNDNRLGNFQKSTGVYRYDVSKNGKTKVVYDL